MALHNAIFSNTFQGYKVCLNLQAHKRHCTMQVRTLFILIIDFLMTLSNVLSELLGIQTVFFYMPAYILALPVQQRSC